MSFTVTFSDISIISVLIHIPCHPSQSLFSTLGSLHFFDSPDSALMTQAFLYLLLSSALELSLYLHPPRTHPHSNKI